MIMKTKNYKFLTILLSLLLWTSASYAQDTIAVSVLDYVACPGDAITVDVDATNINNVGAISLVLNYDVAVLDYDTTLVNATLNSAGFSITNAVGGQVRISWFGIMGSGNLGDITIFQIKFDFINGYTDLGWNTATPGDCQFNNTFFQEIPSTYVDGSVGAPPFFINTEPVSKTILDNTNTFFAVNATGATSYQWMVNDGSGFVNVVDNAIYAGSTTAQLDLTAVPIGMHGFHFKCEMNGPCNMTMSTVTVTLNVVSGLTIITEIDHYTECVGAVVVPVNATNFTNVATVNLKLDFDQSILGYTGISNIDPALAGIMVTDNTDHILIVWTSVTPANIGTGKLFDLDFNANPGMTNLSWDTITAGACQYLDPGTVVINGTFNSGSLTVNPLPGQPATPQGIDERCVGAGTSVFTTTGAANAVTYEWILDPAAAGSIAGASTTGTVNWDAAWAGLATVKVRAMNACGYGVYSNDHNVMIYNGIPVQPDVPTGPAALCVNPPNTDYQTNPVAEATSYTWMVTPPNAGVITGTGTTGTINWGNSFFGTANISVRANNSCGNGIYSNPITVIITPVPSTPPAPMGPDSICQNTISTNYNITKVQYATSYLWELTPASAGTIAGTDTNAIVSWSAGYTGNVTVTVKSVNNCGQSAFAGAKSVYLKPAPGKAATPTGPTGMCINSPNSTYTTTSLANATSYLWTLSPSNAGTLTANNNTAVVDWDNLYTGSAYVKVKGMNVCGEGPFSDSLHITISTPPVFNIGNDTAICQGTAITFTGPGGMASYHWSTGATGPSITVLYPGIPFITYYLTVTDAQGCEGVDSVNVNWHAKPTVNLGSDTTVCWYHPPVTLDAGNPGMNYSWSTGETTQTIIVDSTGVNGVPFANITYSVTVSVNIGCEGFDNIVITWDPCPGIYENDKNMEVSIAPNPSDGQFNVFIGEVYSEIEMTVMNELGQLIHSRKLNINSSGNYSEKLDLTNHPKGIYFIRLVSNNMVKVERVVIR